MGSQNIIIIIIIIICSGLTKINVTSSSKSFILFHL